MDRLVIEGGNPLVGRVRVSGSKNATLPLMCATLLASGRSHLRNVPDLRDVRTMGKLLGVLGAKVEAKGDEVWIDTAGALGVEAPYDLVKTMRASVVCLGPLVAKRGPARVSLPGGCAIGERPIDQHLKGLAAMGAKIELEGGYVVASAKRLKGADITMDLVTVTGTENLMMAAVLAKGATTLRNAAREPEVDGPGAGPQQRRGAHQRRGHRHHHHRGRGRPGPPGAHRDGRPHRGRHLHGGGGHHPRRAGHRRGPPGASHRRGGQAQGGGPALPADPQGPGGQRPAGAQAGARHHRPLSRLPHRHAGPDHGLDGASPPAAP